MSGEFSLALLKKYGWKEGEGLGKSSQGISQPIRANLKFNNLGIGYQEISADQDSKWSNVYSSALSRLSVGKGCDVKVAKDETEDRLNRLGYTSLSRGFKKSDIYIKDGLEIDAGKSENSSDDKPKKKKKTKISNEENLENVSEKKSKKKRTLKVSIGVEDMEANSVIESGKKSKKKRKIDTSSVNSEKVIEIPQEIDESNISTDKLSRKKERKLKRLLEREVENVQKGSEVIVTAVEVAASENETESKLKKKSKKNKVQLVETENLIITNSSLMTCHQSARFGLGMSGKLARAQKLYESERQEKSLKAI